MSLQEFALKCWEIFSNPSNWESLLKGASISLLVATFALIIGIILGILGSSMKMSKNRFLRILGNIYVEVIRGTPMLLQISVFYLVIPTLITVITQESFRVNKLVMGTIAIGINSGAYCTELIRSGIVGIDTGQWEACKALNLSYFDSMRYVILPQAFKQVIPPLVSEYITLIKDSSLLSTIGVMDLLFSAQIIGANYYNYMAPLMMASLMYLVMTLLTSLAAKKNRREISRK